MNGFNTTGIWYALKRHAGTTSPNDSWVKVPRGGVNDPRGTDFRTDESRCRAARLESVRWADMYHVQLNRHIQVNQPNHNWAKFGFRKFVKKFVILRDILAKRMLSSKLITAQRAAFNLVARRNLAVSAVALQSKQAVDPVQQIFLDKVREYKKKSEYVPTWSDQSRRNIFWVRRSAGGKLVDADEKTNKDLDESLNRVLRQFGGKTHEEMGKMPTFNFPGELEHNRKLCRIIVL